MSPRTILIGFVVLFVLAFTMRCAIIDDNKDQERMKRQGIVLK